MYTFIAWLTKIIEICFYISIKLTKITGTVIDTFIVN